MDHKMGQAMKAYKKADESCPSKIGVQTRPLEMEKKTKVEAGMTTTQ